MPTLWDIIHPKTNFVLSKMVNFTWHMLILVMMHLSLLSTIEASFILYV